MNKWIFIILVLVVILGIGGFLVKNIITKPLQNIPGIHSLDKQRINTSVKIVNGDVVVSTNGNHKTITSWGYNSQAVLSPDGKTVAFISETEQSIQNLKTDKGFKRTSTNLWLINSDGTNPVQVTHHIDFVYRSKPHWLDDNKVLFVDGAQSAKVYNISTKFTQTVLGPEKPAKACLDACGFEVAYFYSPDYSYLVRLYGGDGGISGLLPNSAILDTKTLQTKEVPSKFYFNSDSVMFPNNSEISFIGNYMSENQKEVKFTINLATAIISSN